MKKIIFLILIMISVFIIYFFNQDHKIYYTSINMMESANEDNVYDEYLIDSLNNKLEKSLNLFSKSNYKIDDLIEDINNNIYKKENNKKIYIQNVLIKTDILVLFVGYSDLNIENIDNNSILDQMNRLNNLLKILKSYCKEKIYIVGVYYPLSDYNEKIDEYLRLYNNKYKELSNQYNANYIDIYDIFLENKEYVDFKYKTPTLQGYKSISEQIIININDSN